MELIPSLSKKYLGYELKIPKKITFNELINPFDNVIYDYEDDIDDGNYSRLQGIYGIFLKGFMNACDHLASGGQYEVLNGVSIANLLNFTNLRTTQEISSKTKGSAFLILLNTFKVFSVCCIKYSSGLANKTMIYPSLCIQIPQFNSSSKKHSPEYL